ncbi:CPBP family intramembrane glutamic endopeptidase [Microbacterium paraoxydans]|uniref:CPBP family intramembrane glutamic endopeptidase n=1 Tax=Microbacterium paraoxydans TaxID=199592 RepID=UPI0021A28E05|nr:CPBP family intramembrane glutamic endopeptidase [Microbacterium paraoxydans]MCT2224104.1 CPBP family intramembrane metalloprotease [Microbacterium paraoxydans]
MTSTSSPARASLHESPFIADARSGARVTSWWLAIILFLALWIVQIGLLAALTIAAPVPAGSVASQFQEAFANLVVIGLVFAWVGLYERRHVRTLGFRQPGRGVLALLLGIVVGLVLISVPILFLLLTGQYEAVAGPAGGTSGFPALPLILALAVTVIVQGGNEEVVTRGFLLQSVGQRFPTWLAVLVPSLLFTVVHGVGGHPVAFATIFLYAIFATFVTLWQRSLWLICGIHAGWNFGMGNVYGIPVSGLDPHSTSLLFLAPSDSSAPLLTGGDFGTEGGLPAAFTMLAAAAVAFVCWRRSAREHRQGGPRVSPEPTRAQ